MPGSRGPVPVVVWLAVVAPGCRPAVQDSPPSADPPPLVVIYQNDFGGPVGTTFPEWTTAPVAVHRTVTGGRGEVPAGPVATAESPNRRARFLGEFGGPPVGRPGDPDWNRTRADQTVTLTLRGLAAHTRAAVAFDLYVLKSWDGDSPAYGPDRFRLRVGGGPTLLDATFSNNPKVREDGSTQGHPGPGRPPRAGAAAVGTLGYGDFFKDAVYRLAFEFPHADPTLTLEFSSSLFEGKGTADESWGLDDVVVRADVPAGRPPE
jgi:hypothetical protein